ncbi:GGDEF domain-containing response regulator [Janthinobacterium sp. BJB1]|uniref:GGDEF domain-containing response regulator n=1 Tax=Janthinobacterium sp. GW458P TaxID=1981504 RepID=UPI000A325667|nr:diguanylate cyclase [Janthinobacterium sp. GW458P]MBE3025579.1 diguanylate cyclase [Janthinobacterium sp. GW458P]PHV14356.1 GGDEF domain-containing response regulator [Janthinobacterium sp. BJB303]PJD00347.1 GGDEF domain-containing response regulator [Janthinobacterium sp. BJB1]
MPSQDEILKAKILVVDDSPDNVDLMLEILRDAGYTNVTATMRPAQVCPLHLEHCYDLILLDLQMPELNGFQVMKGLKEIEHGGYLPVLALTAQPSFKIAALEAGARDFISKPFDLMEVHKRIHNMLEVRLLYKELAQYSKQQQELALHDPLTGLPNRRLLEDRIEHTLQQSARNRGKSAILYLDLDGFKAINDTYGHGYGDEILKMVAVRLVGASRKEDTVARIGGDEFVIVLGNLAGKGDAREPAAKLIEVVSEPYFINDLTLRLSTSIGIAIYPDDASSVESLLGAADTALYEAKRAGKNRFCCSPHEVIAAQVSMQNSGIPSIA